MGESPRISAIVYACKFPGTAFRNLQGVSGDKFFCLIVGETVVFDGRSLATPTNGTQKTRTVGGINFDLLSETELIRHITSESSAGRGGWVATPNTDIVRQVRDNPRALALVQKASLRVPDGMPLIWAAKVGGKPLVERVTGSSLIFTLTEAAARCGLSVYLLGGEPGVPQTAGENLARRYQGLKVAGTDAPPFGFDKSSAGMTAVLQRLLDAAPNIVFVGLGFPKQERVICEFAPMLPAAWFVACGAAIPFAAGTVPRAPVWMQRSGLEWVHRLIIEPRRLSRRYLLHDVPCAFGLLVSSAAMRIAAMSGKK